MDFTSTEFVVKDGLPQKSPLLEQLGKTYLEWGNAHGAIFDQKKAKLMHFTKKTNKTFTPLPMRFGDNVLQPQTEVQWLGFWLDPKLTFKGHIKRIQSVGKQTLGQLKRINKCFSGLNPKETATLITTILRPRILFGSIVWFTQETWSRLLNHIINLSSNV
ncbi:hypothetical protein CROQUDRAFT_197815 [Cronartium quercuum f. sp. fusiforme G11]|uniref:Uncharacterized protein n=1 Tax=Cronartium quercuum f. sp. fusiforme G11 TaxID=708437 RepID=A0A9P6NNL5_9BASI|nr:hypothetical protein CROQUDRAFT_197815 [Cronartium quercuum f. sp. fusiforme G11]